MSKVIIKAMKKDKWSGFSRFPKCKDSIVPNLGKGGYDIGLTDEERKDLEKRLNMDPGTLSPYSHYWAEYTVRIGDTPLELDLDNPKDYLSYKVCLNSRMVRNGMKDLTKPTADYIIEDQEAEAKIELTKVQIKKEAYKAFTAMNPNQMRGVLKLMGKSTSSASDALVETELGRRVEDNPSEFLRLVKLDGIETYILLKDLVLNNIVREQGGRFTFNDIDLGYDEDKAVDYLRNPKNQDLLIALKGKLEAQMKTTA